MISPHGPCTWPKVADDGCYLVATATYTPDAVRCYEAQELPEPGAVVFGLVALAAVFVLRRRKEK